MALLTTIAIIGIIILAAFLIRYLIRRADENRENWSDDEWKI